MGVFILFFVLLFLFLFLFGFGYLGGSSPLLGGSVEFKSEPPSDPGPDPDPGERSHTVEPRPNTNSVNLGKLISSSISSRVDPSVEIVWEILLGYIDCPSIHHDQSRMLLGRAGK